MAMRGANLEQLTSLEKQFRTQSSTVEQLTSQVSSTLDGTAWTGPAADRFRQGWNGEFKSALNRLREALNEGATAVQKNRQAIEAATK